MKILLANPRGFCAGVDRAISIVENALAKFGAPIYVRHEVVHNRYVVESLRQAGARFVEELAEVPDGQIVNFSAIANQDCSRNFLFQLQTHFALHPSNHIERRDVVNVILVELLLLVDGRRSRDTLEQREDLFLLPIALQVTKRSSLISRDILIDKKRLFARNPLRSGKF